MEAKRDYRNLGDWVVCGWWGASVASFLVVGAAFAEPVGRMADFDGDGYQEAEVFSSGQQVVKTRLDYDHDHRMESVIYYKNGYREHAEQDINGDGLTDRWIYYYFTGTPWKVAEDFKGDGQPNYWFYLKDGKIYKWEQDRNNDGLVDVRTTYELGPDGKTRSLVQQSFDDDFDGRFEAASGITAVKREAMIPHSLAEALLR